MADFDYRRLTRAKSRSLFGAVSTSRASLWLGKDHLLQIDASGYSENYKRFYFRDIQVLVVCRTDTWLYQAVVVAALTCLFGLIALLGGGPVMAWIFGSIAGLFAFSLLLHLVAGPTSKAYLRTAVQTELLVSLNRLRRARRVFDTLRPLITAAQGEFASALRSSAASDQPGPPVTSGVPAPISEPGPEPANPPTKEPA